jgi:hypothetical protein
MKKFLLVACAAVLTVALAAPAMAKVDIGGIVFTDVLYVMQSKELAAGGVAKGVTTNVTDNDEFYIGVPHITRFKARWTNEDNVGMYIEIGLKGDYESGLSAQQDSESLNTRAAYGWWDVSPTFQVMAGYRTTPLSQLSPSQLIGTHHGFSVIGLRSGNLYSGRLNQLRFTFRMPWNPKDRFAIALVNPGGHAWATTTVNAARDAVTALPAVAGGPAVVEETKLPRIDLALPLHFGNLAIYPSVMWAETTYDHVAPGSDDSVTTWAWSLGAKFGTGPFTLSAEVNYVQNPNNQDFLILPGNNLFEGNARTYVDAAGNTKVVDTDWMGWWVDLAFKMGPATPHLIIGSATVENDGSPTLTTDDMDKESWMYGISVPIAVAKGFIIRPELMVYDFGDSEKDDDGTNNQIDYGTETHVGVQFMIVF